LKIPVRLKKDNIGELVDLNCFKDIPLSLLNKFEFTDEEKVEIIKINKFTIRIFNDIPRELKLKILEDTHPHFFDFECHCDGYYIHCGCKLDDISDQFWSFDDVIRLTDEEKGILIRNYDGYDFDLKKEWYCERVLVEFFLRKSVLDSITHTDGRCYHLTELKSMLFRDDLSSYKSIMISVILRYIHLLTGF